ncbi:MAG: hypothetical protein A2504_13220 [Bdellovibrionales bacterium RIFOXYD12_FULL_39_22]|nr:MAG: hypothetical protein A2385_01020 [Bdellovibrionales bacterium RIFOXYB1_FULL_39_21]OFZ43588.1 MAG: hypothetical protein A2485_12690 [Bdellovibrionales bacterium RIFOXYC12_FULL_39_17]OFZ44607.1 MAG: hypothetical protein A2404_10380 [Bdellovibrionales bacterium RIFOXYC1_FULL_39_130]OFZ76366.1 MAG: hypothetical protein A2560_07000 [Bdellovibrionales bacterium RIFOXYD1_FULL_39_84]OFZ94632.1 MAG: hypothetical protein A2504_13220 [Bdellovibrionales bacterium RIFOXYD12_FULL_39_22]HLE12912.1 Ar
MKPNTHPHIRAKSIEIFYGTGGVGKTTIATSRAVFLATQKVRVLLITIDPAHRLKDILHLSSTHSGKIETIDGAFFGQPSIYFDALLMSPPATFQRIINDENRQEIVKNRLLKILSRPSSGMNEILSLIELEFQFRSNDYDAIVLDTPPGKHFLDFLEASKKITTFFDSAFVEIFTLLGKRTGQIKQMSILSSVISSGVNKLLNYLGKVTGESFVHEFAESLFTVYKNRDYFLNALKFGQKLNDPNFSNWYLVTSADQQKVAEALAIQSSLGSIVHADNFLIINKSLKKQLQTWKAEGELIAIKNVLLQREESLYNISQYGQSKTLSFSSINEQLPEKQVAHLINEWPPL